MRHTRSIVLTGLAVLLSVGFLFSSCEKEKASPYNLSIRNLLDFDLRVVIDNISDNKKETKLYASHFTIYSAEDGGKPMNVRVYNSKTGAEVGAVSFQGEPGGFYRWEAGSGNPVTDKNGNPVSGTGGSGGGGGSTGNCPGAEAQHYKDLMDNNPSNDCTQIWALQAAWHAYKCNCDRGMPSSSAASQMVANLNSIRTSITNLYQSGGSGPYTKCGAIPPTVSKCKVE